jgi:hypothetical protein
VGIHEEAHKGVEKLAKKKKYISSLKGEFFFKLMLLFFKFIQSFSFSFVFFKRYKMEGHKLRILQKGQIARGMRKNQILQPSPQL